MYVYGVNVGYQINRLLASCGCNVSENDTIVVGNKVYSRDEYEALPKVNYNSAE